jgi:outer membrane protein TolC
MFLLNAPGDMNASCARAGRFSARGGILFIIALAFLTNPCRAQQTSGPPMDYSRNPEWFPRVYMPYLKQAIPEMKLTNSESLRQWVREGKLQLSMERLKTAVRENNLDILLSDNAAHYAQTDLLRTKGGGAPRGGAGIQIPSSLFAGAIGTGVGGGTGLGGFGSVGGVTSGARMVFGFPRGGYDPTFALGFSVDSTSSPLNTVVVSGLPEVTTHSTAVQTRYSQAFSTGSSLSVAFNNMRQSSTQRFLLYNPNFVSILSVSFTQQLLSGFGSSAGRRFIEAAKKEKDAVQEVVRLQVNTTLAQAENAYWDLVAARENLRVSEQSLAVAQRFYEENRIREEVGTVSGLEVVTAESEVAARQRDLVSAQAAVEMREVELKNFISKDLKAILGDISIEATDVLPEPKDGDIPKLDDALAIAMSNRPELRQADANLQIQDIAVRYARDLLKPTLLFFANFNSSGLYGNRVIDNPGGAPIILPGGMSQAWRQVRSWDYPEYAVGFSFSLNLRNRAAEADLYRAKREKQQAETGLQRTRNNIALEVRKALIGLVQAKARVEAARKAAELSGEVLAAEEARLLEGLSIPYDVIRRQRDYRSAQYAEVQARAVYAKALVERDRAMGILEPASNPSLP